MSNMAAISVSLHDVQVASLVYTGFYMQLTSHDSLDESPEKSCFVFASLNFCCNTLLQLLHGLQMTLQLLA